MTASIFLAPLHGEARMMRNVMTALLALSLLTTSATAQAPLIVDSLSNAGVERASSLFNAVFVDRTKNEGVIAGGDLGSYLMARLGVYPIPPDLKFQVTVDTAVVVLFGRIADLPPEARAPLGPLLGMFGMDTEVAADVTLSRAGPEVIRFRLDRVRIGGWPVPEALLARVMTQVGSQYPVLSRTGRDLFVRVPVDGQLALLVNGVRVWTSAGGAAQR